MKQRHCILMIILVLLASFKANAQPVLEAYQIEECRERLVKETELTPEQEIQVDQIIRTHRQAIMNWQRQNGEILKTARQHLQDAVQAGDRGTFQAAMTELRTLAESRRTLQQTMLNRLEDVLDESQFTKARKVLTPSHTGAEVLQVLPQLQLAQMQQAEIRTILEQAARRAKTKKDSTSRNEIMDAAIETIRQTVLSEPQRNRLDILIRLAKEKTKRRAMLNSMDVTDEQKARINAILAEARQKAKLAKTPQEKKTIIAEAHKTIRRDVWTQQQREKFSLLLVEQYRRRMQSIGMTPEQIDRAEKILTDAHNQAQESANDDEKRQIMRDAFETIRRKVLRSDQREKWNPN